jgi:hypothetical protein
MTNDIINHLKTLNFPSGKEITVSTINEQYRAIIDNENLLEETAANTERLHQVRAAKKYLIENIDAINSIKVSALLNSAKELFEAKKYNAALEEYESISKYLTWGADIETILSADDCIRYGICAVIAGFRIRTYPSYLYAYGYGGRWVSSNWTDCKDYVDIPNDWTTIENNISKFISEHPMIKVGISRECSPLLYDLYISLKADIVMEAEREFNNQESLKEKIYASPDFLANYIGNTQGFFKHDNILYYIYDDGNDNLYPIYRVRVSNKQILMNFYKFSHFRKKQSGKLQKSREFTIGIITENFIQLRSQKGNVPCGQCVISKSAPPLDWFKYFSKSQRGICKQCGHRTLCGICLNFCQKHLE